MRREGKTGSKITERVHQTVCLFTHEPQARYSRVSVECQQAWPNSTTVRGGGGETNSPQNGQSRHFPCDSEFIQAQILKRL